MNKTEKRNKSGQAFEEKPVGYLPWMEHAMSEAPRKNGENFVHENIQIAFIIISKNGGRLGMGAT